MDNTPTAWRFSDDRLDNGLRIMTMEDRRVPIVSVQIWYHVGSKDEDPERQGFAHMFEHMMFRGTDRIGPQDHFRYLQQVGARVNGYTSFDQTVYWQVLPAAHLDLALWLEAERLGRLRIDEEYFAAEREVVKEELRMRVLNRPYGSLREEIYKAAFTQHPYRWTPIGRLDHLNAATADELKEFFRTYYTPNNATLVVVGDVTRQEVLAKARDYFGDLPRGPEPPRLSVVEPPFAGPQTVELTDKAPSPLVACVFRSPPARDEEAIVVDVLARILGSGQSSRIHRGLVQGRRIAVNATAYAHPLEQAGLLVMTATLKPDASVETGEQALIDEIQKLLEQGIDDAEVDKARNQALAAYVRAGETVQDRASQLGYAAVILGDANRVNTNLARLRTVTRVDIMAAARRVLADHNRLSVLVRPDPTPRAGDSVADKSQAQTESIPDLPRPADMPASDSSRAVEVPLPVVRRLDNGLRVLVVSDPAVPAVTVTFGSLSGSSADPPDQAGLAQITAHMLRRGTSRHSGDELAELLDRHGMSLAENADYEDLTVSLWMLSDHLDLGFDLLAEMVQRPSFPQEEVGNYLARSRASRAIDEKTPSTIANERLLGEIFGEHYLARPVDGTTQSLAHIAREAVVAFHKQHFLPDHAALLFAGDITVERALALAKRHFADWAGQPPIATYPLVPPPSPQQIALVPQPGAVQSEIRLGQTVSLTRRDPDYAAARLLSHLFGGSFSSRLNRVLRIERGLTYGARGYFDVKRDAAALRVSTFTRTDRTAEAIRTMIAEVQRLREAEFTKEELVAAQDTLIGSLQVELETPARIAAMHWNLLVWDLPPTWYTRYLADLAAVRSPAELTAVAARLIDPQRLAIIAVGDADELAAQLGEIAHAQESKGD
ncbi:MAG: insulinase family protein [Phycisphaerae bacterium]|nr:insulinase family protein [Phycisphaerae bacterium]